MTTFLRVNLTNSTSPGLVNLDHVVRIYQDWSTDGAKLVLSDGTSLSIDDSVADLYAFLRNSAPAIRVLNPSLPVTNRVPESMAG